MWGSAITALIVYRQEGSTFIPLTAETTLLEVTGEQGDMWIDAAVPLTTRNTIDRVGD